MDSARRPFFTADEDDDEDHHQLVSLDSMEAGLSGYGYGHHNPYSSMPARMVGSSLRSIPSVGSPVSSSSSSPRSGMFFYEPRLEDQRPHFLSSCALCKKPLGNHRDIFMYRGDTAFCSEDCRQERMDMDEAKEKNRSISSLRKKDQSKSSTSSPSKSKDCTLRTGTVAAA